MRLAFAIIAIFGMTALVHSAEPIKPTNLTIVNTSKDEDEPHSTVGAIGTGQLYYTRGGELHSAPRTTKGWAAGKPDTDINQRGDIRGVFVAFAKSTALFPQTVYYATNSDNEKKDGRGDNFDLYMLIRQSGNGGDFSVPGPILTACTPVDEAHPWVTADGKLYFSRKTKDGWRVFSAARPKSDRPFDKPVMLDLPVGLHHPTLSPDGKTMYLQGPLQKNRWGLFRSYSTNGKWSEPEELKDLNNADGPTGDHSPNLSRNGAYLFFSSDRPGGKGGLDIWWVSTEQLKKK